MDEKTISGGSGPSLSWGRTVFAEKKEETYEKTTFEHFLCPGPVPEFAAGGIVCWGYGRGLEIEQFEKAQMRRYCSKLRSQSGAEEKNDKHSA